MAMKCELLDQRHVSDIYSRLRWSFFEPVRGKQRSVVIKKESEGKGSVERKID